MVDKLRRVNNYTSMSNNLWTVKLGFKQALSGDLAETLSEALNELAAAVSLHNLESADGDNWTIALTTTGPPDMDGIFRCLELAQPGFIDRNAITAEPLPEKDWLRHVHDNFPPIKIGGFFIYGAHYKGPRPENLIPLQIDAATAFGSGEHETTQGCLQAFDGLKENHAFKNALDMGCGSGILAIAMVKLWPDIRVTAIDIDPESVVVTERHAAMNAATGKIEAQAGDGYLAPLALQNAPYDIVAANILADPLIMMAPALASALRAGGVCVLSGLLARQEADVVTAHEKQGLKLVRTEKIGNWRALVLQKH